MSSMKVKCPICGSTKTVSPIPTEAPICDNDMMDMYPVKVTA